MKLKSKFSKSKKIEKETDKSYLKYEPSKYIYYFQQTQNDNILW